MAFNKTRLLDSAQKLIAQGKLAQAIAQYQEILRYEPKDQVTLMTVGDLYVRAGDTVHAVEFFQRLAQVFLTDGFTSKAIAIYKKIAKLVPNDTVPLEKLAELYVQQGVMSEARPIFLQLAESSLKGGRLDTAVGLLRRLLDLEPENLRVQMRLAELYQNIGQHKEAALAYLNAAQKLFEASDYEQAQALADRVLQIDPKHTTAITQKARAVAAAGKPGEAIQLLEGLPEQADALAPLLVELHLQNRSGQRAVTHARRAFAKNPEHFGLLFEVAVATLEAGDAEQAYALVSEAREPMAAAGEYDKLSRTLSAISERLSGRIEPLEHLVDICRRAGDSFRLPDALARLGDALAAASELERARTAFEELVERSPGDEHARRKLNDVLGKLGVEPTEEAAAGTARVTFLGENAVAPQPVAEEWMDSETRQFVTQALTDVDLFASYGLTQKATELLETVLKRAPRHTGALEKLLDIALGAGDERRTVELAFQLEEIYRQRGDEGRAEHFSELRRRFQRAAGMTAEELAPPPPAEFTVPEVEAEAVVEAEPIVEPTPAPPGGQAAVYELDLSEEWATMASQVPGAAPSKEAPPKPAPVEGVTSEPPTPEAVEEPAPDMKVAAAPPAESPVADVPAVEEAVEYALELTPSPPAAPPSAGMSSSDFFTELAAELEDLPLPQEPAVKSEAAPTPTPSAAAPAPPPPTLPSPSELSEVFEEFRAELGSLTDDNEDPETHYNLGIAFREMGLIEEAIGEFQRVAKGVQNGQDFRYALQCFTLLALCFMDKNQPKVAAMWYTRALQATGLDQETKMALRYDLGVAQELAGDRDAALDSFTQVYAMNIDYRDVAERIAALEKRA